MNRKLHELRVILRADPKRAGVLGFMLFVLVALTVKAVLFRGPARAGAATRPGAAQSLGGAAENRPGNGATVEKRRRGPVVILPAPPAELRDLFLVDEARFPRAVKPEVVSKSPRKSDPISAENPEETARKARAALEARVLGEAAGLRLRGTLMGASPSAVIESPLEKKSAVLTAGAEFAGFTVLEIRAGSVTLEKEGIRVEVQREQKDR